MSVFSTVNYSTSGSTLYVDKKLVGQIEGMNGLDSGSRDEIDVTSLHSQNFREITLGLADSGTVSFTGSLAPQSDAHTYLDSIKESTTQSSFSYLMPTTIDTTTGAGTTQAKQFTTLTAASIAAAAKGATSVIVEKDTGKWRSSPGISTGDYVKIGSHYHRVAKVEVKTDKTNLTIEAGENAITAASSDTEVGLYRPPALFEFVGQVLSFPKSGERSDVQRFTLDIRVSGAIIHTLGTPDLTRLF